MTMKKYLMLILYAASFLFVLPLPAFAENITCAECGMMSDAGSKYTAKIVNADKTLYFCDIGDLLSYVNKKKLPNAPAWVRDFSSGEWLEAQKAFYVHDRKKFSSPMGWGFASFKEKKGASAYGPLMDFDGALKAVR